MNPAMTTRKSDYKNGKGFVFKIDGTKKNLVTRQESSTVVIDSLETEHGLEVDSMQKDFKTDLFKGSKPDKLQDNLERVVATSVNSIVSGTKIISRQE